MEIERNYCELVRINAPEIYRDRDFLRWLNDQNRHQASWHVKGMQAGEFSDLFFTYDGGEGSDSDMPGHIWLQLSEKLNAEGITDCLVWVTNLEE